VQNRVHLSTPNLRVVAGSSFNRQRARLVFDLDQGLASQPHLSVCKEIVATNRAPLIIVIPANAGI
jgi:hypothetical protein